MGIKIAGDRQHEPKRPPAQLQAWALDKDGKIRTGVFASHRLACEWAKQNGLGEPATKRAKVVATEYIDSKEVKHGEINGNETN